MSLKKYSDAALEAELARRKESKKAKVFTPKPLKKMNWKPLVEFLQDGIDQLKSEGNEPDDFDHYAFELAMEIVYGKDVWDQYNELLR